MPRRSVVWRDPTHRSMKVFEAPVHSGEARILPSTSIVRKHSKPWLFINQGATFVPKPISIYPGNYLLESHRSQGPDWLLEKAIPGAPLGGSEPHASKKVKSKRPIGRQPRHVRSTLTTLLLWARGARFADYPPSTSEKRLSKGLGVKNTVKVIMMTIAASIANTITITLIVNTNRDTSNSDMSSGQYFW